MSEPTADVPEPAPQPEPEPEEARPRNRTRDYAVVAVIGLIILGLAIQQGVLSGATIVLLAVLVPSVILHEISHGVVALAFGDDTAQRAGRLNLNPIRHIDPMGTLILPAVLILATGTGFGYAKPVPVNPARLRSPRNHSVLVSLAGPATNIALALGAALIARAVYSPIEIELAVLRPEVMSFAAVALVNFGLINVVLAAFNLIPLPPLDGSALVERVLPRQWWPAYLRIRPFSMVLVVVLVLFFDDAFGFIFRPAIALWEAIVR